MSAFELSPDDPFYGVTAPENDGGCNHLVAGLALPSVKLTSHRGDEIDVSRASDKAIFFFYPRTGSPSNPSPPGWTNIPGAKGCTPESCAFRDRLKEFQDLGFRVFGVSTQTTEEQQEFATRSKINYEILSDSGLSLAKALKLPTFGDDFFKTPLIKRLTIVAVSGKIAKVFYPVFPPDRHAAQVLDYLRSES